MSVAIPILYPVAGLASGSAALIWGSDDSVPGKPNLIVPPEPGNAGGLGLRASQSTARRRSNRSNGGSMSSSPELRRYRKKDDVRQGASRKAGCSCIVRGAPHAIEPGSTTRAFEQSSGANTTRGLQPSTSSLTGELARCERASTTECPDAVRMLVQARPKASVASLVSSRETSPSTTSSVTRTSFAGRPASSSATTTSETVDPTGGNLLSSSAVRLSSTGGRRASVADSQPAPIHARANAASDRPNRFQHLIKKINLYRGPHHHRCANPWQPRPAEVSEGGCAER